LGFGSFSWRLVFMPDDEPSFDGIENFMSGRAPARSLSALLRRRAKPSPSHAQDAHPRAAVRRFGRSTAASRCLFA
jgi:hypothetical protein